MIQLGRRELFLSYVLTSLVPTAQILDALIEAPDFVWNVQIVDYFSTSRLYTGH